MGKEVDCYFIPSRLKGGRNLRLRQGRCGTIEDNFDRLVSEFDFHSRNEIEDNSDKLVSEFDFPSRRSDIEDNFDRI